MERCRPVDCNTSSDGLKRCETGGETGYSGGHRGFSGGGSQRRFAWGRKKGAGVRVEFGRRRREERHG
ncbi:hypothetical protein L2E82_29047 [Cichorium intybus]|uniref:Uncharacterized protein n=1 Tax=Cichorium intybus TaxID=13427 RepID=A0ACB9CXF1_CICIN|nr:hypothetical protein L2E82_29047 [Cichorium intybus]